MVCESALSLLVLGVLADDHNVTFSLDDLALFADLLNGWFNFHGLPYLSHNYVLSEAGAVESHKETHFALQVIRPLVRS